MPVLLWMALIFYGSTDVLSSRNTSRLIGPFLRWFKPDISPATIELAQMIVRKGGHVTEYAVLGVLLWRAVRAQTRTVPQHEPWPWRVVWIALLIAALYAASDELHQGFVVTRQASAWDVLIDSIGASMGLGLIWCWSKLRQCR